VSLYKDLIKVAAMFGPLNVDEVMQRNGGQQFGDLSMLATLPAYSAIGRITNPITSAIPATGPLLGGPSMGLISILENLITRKDKLKALRDYGTEMAKNPFSMTINELNNLRNQA
jgi:hypothetical protein